MGVSPLGKDHVWEMNLAARAAWMSFVGDLTQSQIAKRLGVSNARVHRLILLARDKGLVRISIEGRPAECLELEDAIGKAFNLMSCTISPYLRDEKASEDIAIASVGQVAGQLLGQHLLSPEVKSVGIGSGRTLLAAINALPSVPRPDIRIYPTTGSLTETLAMDPYDVVSQLADRTGGEGFHLPVPSFTKTEEEAEIYLRPPAVSAVLEGARHADIFISGIAGRHQLEGDPKYKSELDTEVRSPAAEIEGLFFGRLLRRDGTIVDHSASGTSVGVHFDEIAKRTRKGDARIFCLAAGALKSNAVLAALHAGAVSDLVVDETLALKLMDLANIAHERSPSAPMAEI